MSPDAEVCDHWPFTGSAGVADRFPVTDLQSTDERLPARDPKVQYEHIIWDWNGTLLDDLDVCVDVMNGLLTDCVSDSGSTGNFFTYAASALQASVL